MNNDCVFCKIVQHELPATVRFENDTVLAFDSIDPKAPTHIVVIPKQHIEQLATATAEDDHALSALLPAVREIAAKFSLPGLKLVANNGKNFGQVVSHLHLHILSGQISPNALKSL